MKATAMHTENLQNAIAMKPPVANMTAMTLVSRNDGNQSKKLSYETNWTINNLLALLPVQEK